MVCSLHSVTTGSRDRANVPLIIIINNNSHQLYKHTRYIAISVKSKHVLKIKPGSVIAHNVTLHTMLRVCINDVRKNKIGKSKIKNKRLIS